MSYRGEASYQQRGPPGRDGYYNVGNQAYGGPPQHDRYQGPDFREPMNSNFQGFPERRDAQPSSQQDNYQERRFSYNNHQNTYHGQRHAEPPPHRYPETFQQNNTPPTQGSSWEGRNDSNPSQTWRNEPHRPGGTHYEQSNYDQNGYNYQSHKNVSRSPDNRQNYGQNSQYSDRLYDQGPSRQQHHDTHVRGEQENYQRRFYDSHNDGPKSPSWNGQDRNQGYSSQENYSSQYGSGTTGAMDAARDYQNEPFRDRDTARNYSTTVPANVRPNQSQPRDPPSTYDRLERPPQRQYQTADYRDMNYEHDNRRDPRPPPEPPQVIAKTSGSTAVFGLVSRVDNSPTRQHASSPTKTNAPPPTSPTKDYTPSNDQYRDRNPPHEAPAAPRTTQPFHQYHHALTPISEKPSPPSSISSRGNPPESGWSRRQSEGQNYGQRDDSVQPWQPQAERSYQHQPNYNEPQAQYHDRQPQQTRPGYRDFDYNESSGYGSESTHYTERSYNAEQQRYPDKGQYNSHIVPPPSQQQSNDNWPRSPTGNYSQSPPKRPEPDQYRQQYGGNEIRSTSQVSQQYAQRNELRSTSQVSQQYDQRNDGSNQGQCRSNNSYGPPVSIPKQRQFDNRQSLQENRFTEGYGPSRNPASPSSYLGGHPPLRHGNTESGVEESNVKSVRDAKSMFEKQSDPRRPPPAPKPIVAPKPNAGSNVNSRPIPPRPQSLSGGGWGQQQNNNQRNPRSPSDPMSPTRTHYNAKPQQYHQHAQPTHSQSMDHLDERSRHQAVPPERQPQHAQSLQNLDDGSRYPDHRYQQQEVERPFKPTGPSENYRNSYSGPAPADERPMVLAVKYNPDAGPSVYGRQEGRGSWERRQTESDKPQYIPHHDHSPDKPYNGRSSWSAEPSRSNNQQSYPQNARSSAPIQQRYNRNSLNENANFVPDVVARSYELASQSQQSTSASQLETSRSSYENPPRSERKDDYRQANSLDYRNPPDMRKSPDRWPTPPPPIAHDQPPPQIQQNPDNRYNDDWRRLEPQPRNHIGKQPRYQDETPAQHEQPNSYQQEPQGYHPENNPRLQMPPPPRQRYPGDSESSEVDVDAPTPPPSGSKSLRPPYLTDNVRSESPYERNKPVPVSTRNPPDSWRRTPNHPQTVAQPVNSQQHQDSVYQRGQPQTFPSKPQPSGIKSPPPQKPQRNSTSLSPWPTGTNDDQTGFGVGMAATQQLKHPSSRERQRLGKSGALANRKPPSRNNSSSNLLETENDNDYQIEVTDSDISNKPSGIEVHREISMRKFREARKKESTPDPLTTVMERPSKQRASQRVVEPPSDQESEPYTNEPATTVKKSDAKLVFKMPSAEAAKTIPIPQVTEPAGEATRRPPTYLGFGHTPEKPKTDLLSQFKSARHSALKTASEKQDRALKSVSAMVKFSHGKKEPKSPPKPKLTPAERNAKLLDKMHIEVKAPPEDSGGRHSHHHGDHDARSNPVRSSVRSSSTVRPEKYDGDDDTTNGSRHERDRRGRGRDRARDSERAKSRGRSTSRERNLSPDDRGRQRHRSKSKERSLSPEERRRPRRDIDDRRYEERRHRGEDSSYHRRPPSPDRHRYDDHYYSRSPQHRSHPPYDRHRAAREPDWVEQFRRGREASSQPSRRAWVNDPRRVEVTAGGRRRELDMDAFEREVKRATSYNSDFEQPEPRRQMIPTKLLSKGQANNAKRQPPGDWMNALKERNKSAARARFGHVSRY